MDQDSTAPPNARSSSLYLYVQPAISLLAKSVSPPPSPPDRHSPSRPVAASRPRLSLCPAALCLRRRRPSRQAHLPSPRRLSSHYPRQPCPYQPPPPPVYQRLLPAPAQYEVSSGNLAGLPYEVQDNPPAPGQPGVCAPSLVSLADKQPARPALAHAVGGAGGHQLLNSLSLDFLFPPGPAPFAHDRPPRAATGLHHPPLRRQPVSAPRPWAPVVSSPVQPSSGPPARCPRRRCLSDGAGLRRKDELGRQGPQAWVTDGHPCCTCRRGQGARGRLFVRLSSSRTRVLPGARWASSPSLLRPQETPPREVGPGRHGRGLQYRVVHGCLRGTEQKPPRRPRSLTQGESPMIAPRGSLRHWPS